MNLTNYGWSTLQQEYYTSLKTDLNPARIISIKGFKYFIVSEKGELEAELSGRLLFESEPEFLPKVGDWVLFIDYETMGYLVEVFPRRNFLSRKSPGRRFEKQILAANIDHAVIVQGLDRDFNLMRLDRYIAQISACGIDPVVVLNKSDVVSYPDSYVSEVTQLQRNCQVFLCSTVTRAGLEKLQQEIFQPAKTCILIGSSGVGKSSILNALSENDLQPTGMVSSVNQKGKHTTTTRDLFMLPNGAMIIDSPGMREFGVTFEDESPDDEVFPAIAVLAANCRYGDCRHMNESGCAVLNALNNGSLEQVVYESYVKLIKEQRRFQISSEDKKQQAKQAGKMSREATNHRKKHKF
jgi:ribosome biogenesis GTPase / thiamine phosphate phosphatase